MNTRRCTFSVLLLILALAQPAEVRAQLSSEELKVYYKLLEEPDGKAAFQRRLQLFATALERSGDPKRRLSTSYGIDLKRAHIPAAQGVPFLLKFLEHPSEGLRRNVLGMLGEYGADARPAVTRLRQLMDDPIRAVGADAMVALAKIDPGNRDIAAAILDRLGSPQPGTSQPDDSTDRSILQALIRMAAVVPKSAAPRIANFREHRWTETRMYAYEAAGRVLDLERPTLDQLRVMDIIDWRNAPDQGYSILAALQDAGPKASFAMPLLVELLVSDPPVYIQCVAVDTLGKFKTGHPRIISYLLDRLTAGDLMLREMARRNLVGIDLREPPSVKALAKGLRHPDHYVRYHAAVILRSWDQESKLSPAGLAELYSPLMETLREAGEDVPWGNLDVYLSLLKNFGAKAAPVAETMVRLHTSPTYFQKLTREDAATKRARLLAVLANIGVPESARPLVWEALKKGPAAKDDGGHAFAAAARAVGGFSPEARREAIPWLVPALKSQATKNQGEENKFMYIDWTSKIGYPYTSARLEAIRALATIGPDAKEALPLLREIAARPAVDPRSLEATTQREAQRAVAALEGKAGPK